MPVLPFTTATPRFEDGRQDLAVRSWAADDTAPAVAISASGALVVSNESQAYTSKTAYRLASASPAMESSFSVALDGRARQSLNASPSVVASSSVPGPTASITSTTWVITTSTALGPSMSPAAFCADLMHATVGPSQSHAWAECLGIAGAQLGLILSGYCIWKCWRTLRLRSSRQKAIYPFPSTDPEDAETRMRKIEKGEGWATSLALQQQAQTIIDMCRKNVPEETQQNAECLGRADQDGGPAVSEGSCAREAPRRLASPRSQETIRSVCDQVVSRLEVEMGAMREQLGSIERHMDDALHDPEPPAYDPSL
ncbi:hypothetical protein OE88DRAFT_1522356 [Heliocybe sulcata]|uniref:Uncharacterized protein n=1 Tax=Heliocybe sulcata TaxID=5364 RepID=A0A5C3N192_9AGAM|nr:hypothetical protein OE88DRAFT_1522356 [Heliocybe sulcata]